MNGPSGGVWKESTKLGPRVVPLGQRAPKGGGQYKVGSPYSLLGQTYVPKEDPTYDRVGVASWYGELFHGRRTANGEIYDMESITAAHPTLPLPSYARVTNLHNGRSLLVRINDRGPYARGRIIDLSWAAASLLHISKPGTGKVRVQYLGSAPLNGNDRKEREFLARQPWAGPQIAYAESPAKASRNYRQAARDEYGARNTASLAPRRAQNPVIWPASEATLSQPFDGNTASTATDKSSSPKAGRKSVKAADGSKSIPPSRPAENKRQAAPPVFFVEAGRFTKIETAENLAAILRDLAPTAIDREPHGAMGILRVRIGPFHEEYAARQAVERLRKAGLTDAKML